MNSESQAGEQTLTIAVPIAEGRLAMHFGHCQEFSIFQVDASRKEITAERCVQPPPHEPGVLPNWLAAQGTDVIIAGGMGGRAQALFAQYGIQVVTGAPSAPPREVVDCYIKGTLEAGRNFCDH